VKNIFVRCDACLLVEGNYFLHILQIFFFFYSAFTTLYEFQPPHSRGSEITHKDAPQSVGLLWTSNQPVAETSTWQHITLTTDNHPCPRRDSNPQSQQAIGRRHAP
jgi:hypothetical protein